MRIYIEYIIELIKSVILNTPPKDIPKGVSLDKLIEIAKSHNVENIVYVSLSKLNLEDREKLLSYRKYCLNAVSVDSVQQRYLKKILDEFEKEQIVHLPMKGSVIKQIYPQTYYRQSVDIDIFVNDEDTGKVRDIMEGLGFVTQSFSHANGHDEYILNDIVSVEIHRQLISNKCEWDKYCQKIADRLCKQDGCQYRYQMSVEDYYLHMIGHIAKHMKYSGIGIKMIMDIWVYLRKYKDCIDFKIIEERLKECGLYQFNLSVEKLYKYWFMDEMADKDTLDMAKYVAMSGNFGTYSQFISGEMAKNSLNSNDKNVGRFIYYIKLYFLPYRIMKSRYPILEKFPVLLPFLWFIRAFKTLFFDKEKAQIIKNRYNGVDLEQGREIIEFKKRIGL